VIHHERIRDIPRHTEDYYFPLEAKLPAARVKYRQSREAHVVIGAIEREIAMHRKIQRTMDTSSM
jgi:hypothetical protein